MPLSDIISTSGAALIDRVKLSTVQVKAGGRGIGTGVVWRAGADACEIVTNAHVVDGVPDHAVRVTLDDGREAQVRVVEADRQLDLALLRAPIGGAKPARVAPSARLRVGELVFALGNPWGQVGVATRGIVSGAGQVGWRRGRSVRYVRSDVQLAPGNSGGPLVDASGDVVGINAMIFGGDLSVAIPSDVVREWLASDVI